MFWISLYQRLQPDLRPDTSMHPMQTYAMPFSGKSTRLANGFANLAKTWIIFSD
jgi:hypothetical protein